MAMRVVIAEANIFTKLLSSYIRPSVLSVLSSKYSTLIADASLFFTRCLSLYLFTLINAVSDPEKNADMNNKNIRIKKRLSIVIELMIVDYPIKSFVPKYANKRNTRPPIVMFAAVESLIP